MHHRLQLALVAATIALPTLALADRFDCTMAETQAECHARLQCRDDEGLEDCQKRLRQAKRNSGDRDDRDDRKRRDRGRRDDADRDRDRGRRGRSDDVDRDRGRRGRSDDGDRSRRQRGRHGGDRGRHDGGGSSRFESNKTFGLGLELGEPSGLTGKYFFSDRAALDFGIGAIYRHYYYGDGFHLYGDLLFHPVSLASTDAFELPFYIGGGIRLWNFEYCYMRVCDYRGSAVGIRIPIGITFDFNNAPLDIFIQLVPVIDFIDDDYYYRYGDRRHLGIDFSVGVRYWFK